MVLSPGLRAASGLNKYQFLTSISAVKTLLLLLGSIATLFLALASPLSAQDVDIIRGRVTGPDTVGLPGVIVTATTLTGQVSRTARTDRNGRYQISFPGGEGDYWVTFASVGFQMRRYQVKRTAEEAILIADARLQPATVTLDAIRVTGQAAATRSDTLTDVGGTDQTVADNVLDFLSADQLGDLAAMAAAIPGVQLIPGMDGLADAFSVFGLDGDQNNTQLNGLMFGDGSLPRDAQVSLSLSSSPYDVSRGGFSGGQVQIRTRAGSNFMRRNMSYNMYTPQTQFLDARGAATGQQSTNISLGGSASGPFKPDVAFYNASFQYDRRMNDLQTLLGASDLGLQTAGISSDSVSRLMGLLGSNDVPVTVSDFSSNTVNSRANFLGSFDFIQPNSVRGNTFSLTATGNINSSSPVSSAGGGGGFNSGVSLQTPASYGSSLSFSGSAQLRHSGQLGIAGIFSETNIGYSTNRRHGEPYISMPSGTVRVVSTLDDGTQTVNTLRFGGSPSLNQRNSSSTISGSNTLNWFSSDNRHRVKFTTEARHEGYADDVTFNQYGTFSFNSLADLEANNPASFSRTLATRQRLGSQFVGAASLGDAWRPKNDLQVQYGVRVDGNRYLTGPEMNPLVEDRFGLNNSDLPSRLYVSPRLGFSWTYGSAQEVALVQGQARIPRAVVRGGFGVFQNAPRTQLVSGAIDNTGLPSGLQQLNCVGTAAPSPNWSEYQINQASIPGTCADGSLGTVFASSAPNIQLFDPSYAAQRSLRGNLQWSGAVLGNRFSSTVDLSYSRNQHQSTGYDLNFTGVQSFALANEGNRPVFVDPSVIVPATGQIAWREARVYDDFGRVTQQRSNVSSESKQLNVSLRPISFNSRWGWSVSYVLADVREQFNGFNSTVGDPRSLEWSSGSFARHTFQGSLSYNLVNVFRISTGISVYSGSPYTPGISGDVNGDSYGNDRAFIFNPDAPGVDPVVAAGMRGLLANGTREAVSCLQSQLGQLASRNSCTSPWRIMSSNMQVSINSLRIGLPQRANLSFQVSNPLGGLDRLINGQNIKGWGMQQNFDRQLLYVRGFDPVTQQFQYDVNQRFGSTRPEENARRQPMTITMRLSYDLGPSRERQQLMQQLDRGRTRPGNKPSVQQLRGTANIGLLNPMQQIIQQSDSLKLTRAQADTLTVLNRLYVLKSDSIWNPVARFLADLPDRYDNGLAYDRYRNAREDAVDMLIRIVPSIRGVLTVEQWRMLPQSLQSFMDKRYLQSIRSGTQGGGGGGFGR